VIFISIEVKIPKEIKEYEEKFILGFPLRQTLSILVSVAVSVIIYGVCRDKIDLNTITTIISLIIAPIFLIGFIKYEGLTLERYMYLYFKSIFSVPQNRKMEEISVIDEACKESITVYEEAMSSYRKAKKKLKKFK
jgi:hypothetical protein